MNLEERIENLHTELEKAKKYTNQAENEKAIAHGKNLVLIEGDLVASECGQYWGKLSKIHQSKLFEDNLAGYVNGQLFHLSDLKIIKALPKFTGEKVKSKEGYIFYAGDLHDDTFYSHSLKEFTYYCKEGEGHIKESDLKKAKDGIVGIGNIVEMNEHTNIPRDWEFKTHIESCEHFKRTRSHDDINTDRQNVYVLKGNLYEVVRDEESYEYVDRQFKFSEILKKTMCKFCLKKIEKAIKQSKV